MVSVNAGVGRLRCGTCAAKVHTLVLRTYAKRAASPTIVIQQLVPCLPQWPATTATRASHLGMAHTWYAPRRAARPPSMGRHQHGGARPRTGCVPLAWSSVCGWAARHHPRHYTPRHTMAGWLQDSDPNRVAARQRHLRMGRTPRMARPHAPAFSGDPSPPRMMGQRWRGTGWRPGRRPALAAGTVCPAAHAQRGAHNCQVARMRSAVVGADTTRLPARCAAVAARASMTVGLCTCPQADQARRPG